MWGKKKKSNTWDESSSTTAECGLGRASRHLNRQPWQVKYPLNYPLSSFCCLFACCLLGLFFLFFFFFNHPYILYRIHFLESTNSLISYTLGRVSIDKFQNNCLAFDKISIKSKLWQNEVVKSFWAITYFNYSLRKMNLKLVENYM